MTTSSSQADTDALQATVERLTDLVRCLTMAVDELTSELHWRNNQLADALNEWCPLCSKAKTGAGQEEDAGEVAVQSQPSTANGRECVKTPAAGQSRLFE